jgi:hypothetical protein
VAEVDCLRMRMMECRRLAIAVDSSAVAAADQCFLVGT